jgi:hypothetical protein
MSALLDDAVRTASDAITEAKQADAKMLEWIIRFNDSTGDEFRATEARANVTLYAAISAAAWAKAGAVAAITNLTGIS